MRHTQSILALAAALCLPVFADETPPAAPAAKTSASNAAERKASTAAKKAKRAPGVTAQPVVETLPDGTQMIRLDERFHNYVVLHLTPDGVIERACVHGPDEAEAFAKGAARAQHAEEK